MSGEQNQGGWHLVVIDGPAAGRRVPVDGSTTVGRSPGMTVSLPQDGYLSGRHLRIEPVAAGLLLTDLGSTNGSYLNGERFADTTAFAGDQLRVGSITFAVDGPIQRPGTTQSPRDSSWDLEEHAAGPSSAPERRLPTQGPGLTEPNGQIPSPHAPSDAFAVSGTPARAPIEPPNPEPAAPFDAIVRPPDQPEWPASRPAAAVPENPSEPAAPWGAQPPQSRAEAASPTQPVAADRSPWELIAPSLSQASQPGSSRTEAVEPRAFWDTPAPATTESPWAFSTPPSNLWNAPAVETTPETRPEAIAAATEPVPVVQATPGEAPQSNPAEVDAHNSSSPRPADTASKAEAEPSTPPSPPAWVGSPSVEAAAPAAVLTEAGAQEAPTAAPVAAPVVALENANDAAAVEPTPRPAPETLPSEPRTFAPTAWSDSPWARFRVTAPTPEVPAASAELSTDVPLDEAEATSSERVDAGEPPPEPVFVEPSTSYASDATRPAPEVAVDSLETESPESLSRSVDASHADGPQPPAGALPVLSPDPGPSFGTVSEADATGSEEISGASPEALSEAFEDALQQASTPPIEEQAHSHASAPLAEHRASAEPADVPASERRVAPMPEATPEPARPTASVQPPLAPAGTPAAEAAFSILSALRTPLFALVDAAADPAIPELLQRAALHVPTQSLFDGERAISLARWAPYLLDLRAGHAGSQAALSELLRRGWGRGWASYFISSAAFGDLRAQLRASLTVRVAGGAEAYFRFYDPRVLRDYLPTAQPIESAAFFGPIEAWLLEGQDGERLFRLSAAADGSLVSRSAPLVV